MRAVAERILPGEPVAAVADHLDHDATRTVEGVDAFQRWNQELIDRTIAELNGTHFDIAPPLRRCEAMIAPPGGAAAMYYTGPSEDFTRPGRTWYPTQGKTTLPAVARSEHLLPRGRARSSPAGRAGEVPRRRSCHGSNARSGSSPGTAKGGRSTRSG